jgi:AcrR family transcriptional regulator
MATNKQEARAEGPASATGASRGGTLGSTRRPPDDARRSILSAADRLFYEQGIRAVGVDAVADAAGVTKRTLYYHFGSKEDLVAAYLEARDEVTVNALRNLPTERGSRPGDRILAVFDFLETWFAGASYRGCPFNNAVAEQSGPKASAITKRHKETVRSWFAELAAAGGAQRPDEVGARLLVLLDGALNGAAVFGTPEPAIVARTMAESLLDSAGVSRSPPKPSRDPSKGALSGPAPIGAPERAPRARRRS